MSRPTIAVLFGGQSSEHEISLQSAAAVIRQISPDKYHVICLGITRQGHWLLFEGTPEEIEDGSWERGRCTPCILSPDAKNRGLICLGPEGPKPIALDAAFPILHGKNGEDGTVQGLLELARIPCIGCGLLSSALCMDKLLSHKLAAQAGIRVPRAVCVEKESAQISKVAALLRKQNLMPPLFVKPLRAGSSFGISKIESLEELSGALGMAFSYDREALIEEAVPGFEVGCAVLGTRDLFFGEVDEIELSGGFFDFTEKYTLKTSRIHMPARIPAETASRIRETAAALYRLFSCSGFARVDLFLTPEGEIVFNEINTIPGFTSHSRYPNMMKGAGLSFSQLVDRILEEALAEKKAGRA